MSGTVYNGTSCTYADAVNARPNTWGAFFVRNPRRSLRPPPAPNEKCPFCHFLDAGAAPASVIDHAGHPYAVVMNGNPIVPGQLLVSPCPGPDGGHVVELCVEEAELALALIGDEQALRRCREVPGRPPAAPAAPPRYALYLNATPLSARSYTHLHLNLVPEAGLPLLPSQCTDWEVAYDASTGCTIRRLDAAPFYALAFTGSQVASALARCHRLIREVGLEYNLLVYGHPEVKVIVVPRTGCYSAVADQKIGGLELLTGVLIPGPGASGLDRARMVAAFAENALTATAQLALEQRLRGEFGLPNPGWAVVAVASGTDDRPGLLPAVKPNPLEADAAWSGPAPARAARDPGRVLVRVRAVGLCATDRRVLAGRKKLTGEPGLAMVLGHEGGGSVIDPGAAVGRLFPGDRVVILPHLTCGNAACPHCSTYQQNRCPTLRHGGLGSAVSGCFATIVAVPPQCVMAVPHDFPIDALPMVEPLACSLRGLLRASDWLLGAGPRPVVIWGGGPMGCLLAAAAGRFFPHSTVTIVEPDSRRRQLITELRLARAVAVAPRRRPRVAIVACSNFAAVTEACDRVASAGGVVLFAGIHEDQWGIAARQGGPSVALAERIHRGEEVCDWTMGRRRFTLIGSSGYGFDDVRKAIVELATSPAFRALQTAVIEGLASHEVRGRDGRVRRLARPAIEALLAPRGIDDPEFGMQIAENQKVLVHV